MKIFELKYSVSNHYLIEGESGRILFDTGWAGTLPDFCRVMGELQIPVQSVDYVLISHFHPDHCGIAQEIADLDPGSRSWMFRKHISMLQMRFLKRSRSFIFGRSMMKKFG